MAKTFQQMVSEAMGEVPTISPAEARKRIQKDPQTLVVDVRDAADINAPLGHLRDVYSSSLQVSSHEKPTCCHLHPQGA